MADAELRRCHPDGAGHGSPQTPPFPMVERTRRYVERLRETMREAVENGVSLLDAMEQTEFEDWKAVPCMNPISAPTPLSSTARWNRRISTNSRVELPQAWMPVYGASKVWRQPSREQIPVARGTMGAPGGCTGFAGCGSATSYPVRTFSITVTTAGMQVIVRTRFCWLRIKIRNRRRERRLIGVKVSHVSGM